MRPSTRDNFVEAIRLEQEQIRTEHSGRTPRRALLTLDRARERKPPIDWRSCEIAVPSFTGIRTLDHFPLDQIVPFIDWSPFFHAWELRGRYPEILDDATAGERAKELYSDARRLLEEILAHRLIAPRAV